MVNEIETSPFDVAELLQCRSCGQGMMHSGNLVFYEVTARQCVVDVGNVQRMHGMEMLMGGAVGLARALSPSNTVAQRIGRPVRSLLCMECALAPIEVATLVEERESSDDRS